jgi:hypothetical protein
MGASMVCSCAAAAGTAGVTSSADEVTPAVPADNGGGAEAGGGRRPTAQAPSSGMQEAQSGRRLDGVEAAAAET